MKYDAKSSKRKEEREQPEEKIREKEEGLEHLLFPLNHKLLVISEAGC